MLARNTTGLLTLALAMAAPAAARAQAVHDTAEATRSGPLRSVAPVRLPMSGLAVSVRATTGPEYGAATAIAFQVPSSREWARFGGGLLTELGALGVLASAMWESSGDGRDAEGALLTSAAMVGGTLVGAAVVTSASGESPNRGMLLGALAGVAPLVISMATNDDGLIDVAIITSLFTTPLGAAVGQRLGH